jgi:hypothetical protein
MELQSATHSDGYWELHRRLEREGRIDHSAGGCSSGDPVVWRLHPGTLVRHVVTVCLREAAD